MIEIASLPIASMQKRVGSFVIDDIVIAILLFIIFYTQLNEIVSQLPSVSSSESMETIKDEMNQFSVNNLFFILMLKVLYHTLFVWQNGMTLGKYFMKIKVVELNTKQRPTFIRALLRALFRIASEVFFYLGFLFAFFSPLKQTLHDRLSDCVVVDA